MNLIATELSYFFEKKTTRINLKRLILFLLVLIGVVLLFSFIFQIISSYEGQEHSWISGLYWTLVTMSTLGFGDIVFASDIGRVFSAAVLVTGVVFLLVMLPFTFIQFFYAPWLEAQAQARAPRRLPVETKNHILITKFNSVAVALIEKLKAFHYRYWIVVPELSEALEISDMGYEVVHGNVDDPETWKKLQVGQAAMVVANDNERVNTNVTFTIRELSESVPVISFTNSSDAVDILKLAGSNLVLNLSEMMGQALVRRVVSGSARVHVIGRFQELVIAEAPAMETPLVGKTLTETRMRELTGVNIVGIWERGKYQIASSETLIKEQSILVLVGTVASLRRYDELMGIYHATDAPVIVLGGGKVGTVVARALKERQILFKIVERLEELDTFSDHYIVGDAADFSVLKEAGIDDAHTVIITPNEDDTNIYLTLYCRRLRPEIQIISRATLDRNLHTLRRAGADFSLSYSTMGANAIFNYLQSGEMVMLAEGLNIFKVDMPEKLCGKKISDLELRDRTGCTIVGVEKDGEIILQPEPDSVLEKVQKIILIGDLESEKRFWKYYNDGKPSEGRRKFFSKRMQKSMKRSRFHSSR
ncbi:MAG: potassium channel protein [Balneolaceae bacterium]|nr:MAG: potassium channel protein [Balneolaceae bacterium]